jgi:hypothetical protein
MSHLWADEYTQGTHIHQSRHRDDDIQNTPGALAQGLPAEPSTKWYWTERTPTEDFVCMHTGVVTNMLEKVGKKLYKIPYFD